MTTRHHLLPIALAGTIASWTGVAVAPAHPAAVRNAARSAFTLPSSTPPSFLLPRPHAARPSAPKPSDPPPITFFVATGPADACGPGCDTWIAAEGRIDLYAARRLRKVLARLGPRKLPLYLHSSGGLVLSAIELGRLVRSHGLTVSVARTLPSECPRDEEYGKACETLKRSGKDLAAELDPSGAMCNSACVLVLAGGARRSVPPWVRLGVHAIWIDRSKTTIRGPRLAAMTRSANERIVAFLRDMGIPKALFDASNAVPHETSRFLRRDELVEFGLDTRDFGETGWLFAEKPYAAVEKGFFVHTGDAGLAYPEALLRLNCGVGKAVRLTFAREREASAAEAGARPLRITVNGMRIDLPAARESGNIDVRTATLWPDALVSAGDAGVIEVSGFGASRGGLLPDDKTRDRIVLNMTGFSAAYAKLQKACSETASVYNGCSPGDPSPRCAPAAMKTARPAPAAAAWPSK